MTEPEVFIIESLRFDDEQEENFEGYIISQILHLRGKKSMYYYIRTRRELEKVLELFDESNYRYLHLSCHGNEKTIWTTLDPIRFSEFGKLVRPYLRRKRLFISACSVVNDYLARKVIPSSGCYSIIGPNKRIDFDVAAIMWASFYQLVFNEDPNKITREDIKSTLQKVVDCFGEPLIYFSTSRKMRKGYKKKVVKPRKR